MTYEKSFLRISAVLALISLTACVSTEIPEKPVEETVRQAAQELHRDVCQPASDLLTITEEEPPVPDPRDPEQGLLPDELVQYTQDLSEWGARGWHRVQDWIDRDTSLGSCVHIATD